MKVSRSITIDTPIEKVYESIANFREWPRWSPWLITEPDCEVTYADDGKSYSWNGKYVGSGQMRVVDSVKNESIHYDLQFLKPWKSSAKVNMQLQADGDKTQLSWNMDSSLPFFMFFLKKMMEGMIGMDYERGLSMLKDLLETGEVPVQLDFGEADIQAFTLLGRSAECSIKEMPASMESDVAIIKELIDNQTIQSCGKMMSVYHKWDLANQRCHYTIGVQVDSPPENLPDGFVVKEFPALKAFTSQLTGPYRHLGNAWSAGIMRSRSGAFKQSRKVHPFETYENDPTKVDENDLITKVHFPMK